MPRQAYPTDLTDAQWSRVEKHFPEDKPNRRGRKRAHSYREIMDAIFYFLVAGCVWRLLPHELPWKTVYHYFRLWTRNGAIEAIHTELRQEVRKKEGRDPEPSAGIIDSRSVKTTVIGGERGYDAGKKINGRKRHILVDTIGMVLMVVVHAANIQDRDGARIVLEKVKGRFSRLKLIWADGGYAGQLIEWVKTACNWVLEIVKRPEGTKGFLVLPRRWVVERTFSRLGHCRRLSKDYEHLTAHSESMIYLAMIRIMVRRLTAS
jgi:putative transposase